MKKNLLLTGICAMLCLSIAGDLPGRGFGGGGGRGFGGGGGGFGGGRSFGGGSFGGGREGFGGGGEFRGGGFGGGGEFRGGGFDHSPSVGRPSWEGGYGRPGGDGFRPSGFDGGFRPGGYDGGFRPGGNEFPTRQGLQNFLDIPGGGGAGEMRPAWAGGGVANRGAAAEFLEGHQGGFRPGEGGAGQLRPGNVTRPGQGGAGEQRPISKWASNHPNKIPDRNGWNNNRQQRRDQIANHWRDNGWNHHDWYNRNWWDNHHCPWGWNHPWGWYWGWGTWAGLSAWIPWGWSDPVYYNYGDNVYYSGDSVYYGDQPIATQQQYADQAQQIASSVPQDVKPANDDWMSLGVFAVTQDGQSSGSDPNMYIQLAVSKQGIIAGTYQNTITNQTQNLEGMVDKKTQRAAWTVSKQKWPVMETGIYNLTQKSAPMLVHFANGQTQQWLMVHVDEPKDNSGGNAPATDSQ